MRMICAETRAILRAIGIVAWVPFLTAGCAAYAPRPLPVEPNLETRVQDIQIDVSKFERPDLGGHAFDPADGLDIVEIAQLAVVNNPDLKAQRSRSEVARAQAFAARLLPDPQVNLSGDYPSDNIASLVSGYGLGISYDLQALVTRGASVEMAQAAARQIDLDALWQEWQVIQQARILYVQNIAQTRKLDLQRRVRDLFSDRYAHSAEALKRGNLTLDVTGTDLTALMDADSQIDQIARQLNQTRHDLNALLGLRPELELAFNELLSPRPLDSASVDEALAHFSERRPDLLALQAGYRSQEAAVRRAVLAQFPSLSVGITRARDTGDVHTTGFGITLNLPIFSGNRGEIAVQRATREQLREEYQARLDQTLAQVDLLRTQAAMIDRQRATLAERLPTLEQMAGEARRAYEAGNMAALTYLNLENTLLNKQLELVDLEQDLWDTDIGLDTLLARPLGTTEGGSGP